jgi:CheY-like chemotaxis protein/nitrogen-specific signal transduction histidine kinase/CHASE3 domain sensor protein
MVNKRFGYVIIAAFCVATLLVLIIQYNFSDNMNTMLNGNVKLVKELHSSNHLREVDRDILGVESRIRAAIATNDTSHLEGINTKIASVKTYLDSLDENEPDKSIEKYLKRLSELASEKVTIKNALIKRYIKLGNMNDTSFIANPRARRISDEITNVTQKIYDSRQQKMVVLTQNIISGSKKTKFYSNVLICFILVSGGVLCWFIYSQFRQQNRLIIKLDASERTARDALQIKENFLANMSHEIRTPLNSIIGFTNLLKRRKQDATSTEFVDAIEKAGENLMAIINDILDLSKIEAGMMRIVAAPFSVRGLTHSLETLFKEKVKEKGLALKSNVNDDVPDTLVGDATRLTQILVNLIGNAIKFSDSGTVEVNFYNQSLSNGNIHLGVQVKDNGIGINKEKLDKIFERFNQAEDSITRNYGGTGLGLSIVKTLIQLQNGHIEVSSDFGNGTTFDFIIPYTDLQILIVDDNVMNQSLMKHLLMQWDISFSVASNGGEAIQKLETTAFDLVLMDIQMPKMDGYTAARYIRDDLKSTVPIIAMTAHAMAGEREKCLSNGMNEYISKPVNEELLFKLISKFVSPKKTDQGLSAQNSSALLFQTIDLSYMKEISKGNSSYEKVVTEQFIGLVPDDVRSLFDAFESSNITVLNRIAHNMKTSVAIMGLLPRLEQLLDEIENATAINTELYHIIEQVQTISIAAVEEAMVFNQSLQENK